MPIYIANHTEAQAMAIDLTIIGNCTWKELNKLESELDDIMLPYQFDLSLYEFIDNKQLIEHINRVGKVFYSRE